MSLMSANVKLVNVNNANAKPLESHVPTETANATSANAVPRPANVTHATVTNAIAKTVERHVAKEVANVTHANARIVNALLEFHTTF